MVGLDYLKGLSQPWWFHDYYPLPWGPGCQMMQISIPASQRTCWVWTGFRRIQLWCAAGQWNKHKIQMIYGYVAFLKLCFPSKNYFLKQSCCVSTECYYFGHHDNQLMKRWNKMSGGPLSSGYWEGATRSCVFWDAAPMWMVFRSPSVNLLPEFCKNWKILSRKFHYQDAFISDKFCKNRQKVERNRKNTQNLVVN